MGLGGWVWVASKAEPGDGWEAWDGLQGWAGRLWDLGRRAHMAQFGAWKRPQQRLKEKSAAPALSRQPPHQPPLPPAQPSPKKSNFKKTLSLNTFRPKLRHLQQPVTPESPQLSLPLPGGESIIRTSFWALFGVSKNESWIKDRDGIVFPVIFLARRC